jgi:ABC-type phosphate transport system substrate-binding protein
MKRRATLLLLFLSLLSARSESAQQSYRVIVHPDNPVQKVERTFLARAFLKKVTEWPDGEAIRPVDLAVESMTRQQFVEEVLKRSIGAVRNYWQQRIFSGRGLPPPELESEEKVIMYVLQHRGAVGYVSERADVGNAKVVAVD